MNNLMKSIIINKNKNYIRRIAIILLMFVILYFLGFKFLRYPSEHTYFLLPTENVVIVFSIFGILACLLAIYIVLKNIFRKKAFLKIDEDGIFNGFFLYKKKLVRWEEIAEIKTLRYNNNNYIGLFLKEVKNNERGIESLLFNMNQRSMGTPYIIYYGDLECSFEDLRKTIIDSWEKYKK
ncbi:STM3941 family protein [Chryseobacterium sp. NRRL B-14859]|uniref:STM3941 family protein n=1 Tax=Chryseobacterium sp. NRRL B-14859 TaxID=1562763 RepID=UPI003396EC94